MKRIARYLAAIMLVIGFVLGFTACDDDTAVALPPEEPIPMGGETPPLPLMIYLEDENGVNLLSSVEGNWLYSPFSMTCRDETYSIRWEYFSPERHGGTNDLMTIDQVREWDGTQWAHVPDLYYISFGRFWFNGLENAEMVFHFEELNHDYAIKLYSTYDNQTKKTGSIVTVDGAVAATNSNEIHLVVPRKG